MLASLLLYALIPIASAVIGWATNVLAIRMMFAPLEFRGLRPSFGWQGIIPSKARKMATICADLLTSRLLDIEAVFSRLDPSRIASELQPVLEQMTRDVTERVVTLHYPRLWEYTPARVKERTFQSLHAEIPPIVERTVRDLQGNIKGIVDPRRMIIEAFVRNKALLVQLFQRCGGKEFAFIGRSGFVFGGAFGLVQMVFWIFFKPWWLLPLAGLLVGYATNWLALKMIFEPREPKRFGPFRWQGLFLKRQQEVAEEYATFFAREVFKPKNIVAALLRGPSSDPLIALVHAQLKLAIDSASGYGRPFIALLAGTERYEKMKQEVCDELLDRLPYALSGLYDYAEEALDLQGEVQNNLERLSSPEFERVLRPIFQEDEWTLIIVGAVLGLLAGAAQLLLW